MNVILECGELTGKEKKKISDTVKGINRERKRERKSRLQYKLDLRKKD